MAVHIAGMRVQHGVDALLARGGKRRFENLVTRTAGHHVLANDILEAIIHGKRIHKLGGNLGLAGARHIGQALAVGHHVHVADAKIAVQKVSRLDHAGDA